MDPVVRAVIVIVLIVLGLGVPTDYAGLAGLAASSRP